MEPTDPEKTMVTLALPPFEVQLQRDGGADGTLRIYDALRRQWLVLTPEEWVRQHFVNFLIANLGYPSAMIANEVGLRLNGMQRRCDTVVYSRQGLRPLLIVEYKRPSVEITAKVFDQIARYNSVLGAPWLMVSNGLRHYCCRFTGSGYTFARTLPTYEDLGGE